MSVLHQNCIGRKSCYEYGVEAHDAVAPQAMSSCADSRKHLLVTVVDWVIPFLTCKDVVRVASCSRGLFVKVQANEAFWKEMDFSSNHFQQSAPSFSALVASELSKRGELIRGLNFSFCTDIDDHHMGLLPKSESDVPSRRSDSKHKSGIDEDEAFSVEKVKGLSSLILNHCHGISNNGLIIVARSCHCLESFEIYQNVNITDDGVIPVIVSSRRTLRRLNLSGCKRLSDDTVRALALHCCSTLEHLDMTRMVNVSSIGVRLICEKLYKLRTLTLYACHHLDSSAFRSLHKLQDLEVLDLCGCTVSDADLARVASKCKSLRVLNLTWCVALTDKTLQALSAMPCGRLESLSLHGVTNLTEKGLESLAKSPHAEHLRILDVRGCKNIWEKYLANDFEGLRKVFPRLTTFVVHT